MKRICIKGGKKLYGEIDVQGAKNSSLPILSAALICESPCVILIALTLPMLMRP